MHGTALTHSEPTVATPLVSVVVPTLDEADEIGGALLSARDPRVELLVVDGRSSDATAELARVAGARVLFCRAGRAAQMNLGAHESRAPLLLFLHADARLPPRWLEEVLGASRSDGFVAGAFRLRIDGAGLAYRLIERVAGWRSTCAGLPYGDQALFLARQRFEDLGGFADLEFMEDFEIARRLRRQGPIRILPQTVRVSARRWRRLGAWRVTLINQLIVAGYLAGMPPARLKRWYRGGRLLPPRGSCGG